MTMINFPRIRHSVCLIVLAWAGGALADSADTFNVYLGMGLLADSNLFRTDNSPERDTILTSSLNLSLNKPLAQQRFVIDVSLIDYRYDRNSYLDFTARNLNALWQWTFTPALVGQLSHVRTENLNSFVDYTAVQPELRRNIRENENSRFDADWHAGGGLHLLAAISRQKQQNSEFFRQESSYELDGGDLGARYIWRSGASLQLVQRSGRGEYTGRKRVGFDVVPAPFNSQYDTAFRQRELEMRLSVPLTGKSTLSARLARQKRTHDYFYQRDYAETIGRLEHTWQPSGRLSLTTAVRREVGVYQDFASSYYLSDGVSLQPAWQMTNRVSARLAYDWQRRRYEGAIFPGLPQRREDLQSARASVDWLPDDRLAVNLAYQRDERDANQRGRDFVSDQWSLNLRLNF